MNLRIVIATATTAAVLATGGVALAGAANSSSPASSSPAPSSSTASAPAVSAPGASTASHPRLRRLLRIRRLVVTVVTQTVGIDRATLRADLRNGQTIAAIATAHGVDPNVVINALVTAATTKLDAAAQAGRITEARAHRIEQRLPARVTKLVNTWLPKRARTSTT